jgi:glycosyltransferase involved in cell wall biosynthesis
MQNKLACILIAGELSSLHFRRWCEQLHGSNLEIHLLHLGKSLPGNILEWYTGFTIHFINNEGKLNAFLFWIYYRLCRIFHRPFIDNRRYKKITKIIKKINPDILHSHGLNIYWQNYMYDIYTTKKYYSAARFPLWLYTTWGTDLDFFPKYLPEQDSIIRMILPQVDVLATECDRDTRLAYSFGFNGKFWGKIPMFGGITKFSSQIEKIPPAERRLLIIKGRDQDRDPVGRAGYIFDALETMNDVLQGWRIIVLQATPGIRTRVAFLYQSKINITAPDYFSSYNEVLSLYAQARAFIAMTINDGLPSSLCEAMASGALPIHSYLEPIAEWITNGKNGLLTPVDDIQQISNAIKRAITDDDFVESAAEENRRIVGERLNYDFVRENTLNLYFDSLKYSVKENGK